MRFFTQTEGYIEHFNSLIQLVENLRLFQSPQATDREQGFLPLSHASFKPIRRVFRKDMDLFYWRMFSVLHEARQYFASQPQLPQHQQCFQTVLGMLEKVQPLVSSVARGALVYNITEGVCDSLEFDNNVYQFTLLLLDNSANASPERFRQLEALALDIQAFVQQPGAIYAFNIARSLSAGFWLLCVAATLHFLHQYDNSGMFYTVLLVCTAAFTREVNKELKERQTIAQFKAGDFLKAVRDLPANPQVLACADESGAQNPLIIGQSPGF